MADNTQVITQKFIAETELLLHGLYEEITISEMRDGEQVQKILMAMTENQYPRLAPYTSYLLWEQYLKILHAIPDANMEVPESFLGVRFDPPLVAAECSLFMSLMLAEAAKALLEQEDLSQKLEGAFLFLAAQDADGYWQQFRGKAFCRNANKDTIKMHVDFDHIKFRGFAKKERSAAARELAEKKHGQPGGSRDKRAKICEIWASGKYSSRDVCAEQEAAALEMSFATARKALIGTPEPKRS